MSSRPLRLGLRASPALFVVSAVALLRPFGDFPLNDDWAYARSVFELLDTGRLRLSDWVPASTAFHVLWGSLWARLLGESHAVLRLSGAAWLALGGLGVAATARRLGAGERAAAIAGLSFVANPLALVFGLTFHTDVPFVALGVLALWAALRFDADGRTAWMGLAGLCVAAAITTRQVGIGFEAGLLALLWRRHRHDWLGWLAALVPPLVAGGIYLYWIERVHPPTWARDAYLFGDALTYLSAPSVWVPETLRRLLCSAAYAAGFALPLVVALRIRVRPAPAAAVVAALAAAAAAQGPWPWFANAFGPGGLGTVTLHGRELRESGFFGNPLFAWATTLAMWGALAAFVLALWTRPAVSGAQARASAGGGEPGASGAARRPPDRGALAIYALCWALVFAAMLPKSTFFDRYLIVALPPVLVAAAALAQPLRGVRLVASLAALALLATVALAGTADYQAWNGARWRLARRAVAAGLATGELAGGIEWDAWWTYDANMARLKATRPLARIGRFDWRALDPPRSLLSFAPGAPPWVRVVDEEPYHSPLAPGRVLSIYRLERARTR